MRYLQSLSRILKFEKMNIDLDKVIRTYEEEGYSLSYLGFVYKDGVNTQMASLPGTRSINAVANLCSQIYTEIESLIPDKDQLSAYSKFRGLLDERLEQRENTLSIKCNPDSHI